MPLTAEFGHRAEMMKDDETFRRFRRCAPAPNEGEG